MTIPLTNNPPTSAIADRIARVAARLFAADGYDATSVRNIVEAAAVTKPTLYYYFSSKEALAQTLLTASIDKLAEALREIVARPECATERLVAVIDEHFKLCRDDPDRARFAYAMFFGPRSSQLSAVLAGRGESLAEHVCHAVTCLADEGVIAANRTDECTAAVRGLIAIYTMDYLYRDLQLDSDLARRLVVDLLKGFEQSDTRSLPEPRRN